MSNEFFTLEDLEGKELNPNPTLIEALLVVVELDHEKSNKGKANVEADSIEKIAKPIIKNNTKKLSLKKPMRKSLVINNSNNNSSKRKVNDLEIPTEEWINQLSNKKKIKEDSSNNVPLLPDEFKQKINEKCSRFQPTQIIHVYQKKLYSSDVSKNHGRLTMPLNKIESFEFLEHSEITSLRHRENFKVSVIHKPLRENDDDNGLTSLDHPLIVETTLTFAQWDLHKNEDDRQNISYQYVLNGGWNKIVFEDKLQKDDIIDVWAFRDIQNKLCMVVVRRE
ncbi:uncharacterized protein LOC129317495 [Prosopis cineraria]|uniref:uncharacterized protein LOC129317495 n=1 Tax=Prosopis cineraria TaxID=364024 RepID=UPI002410A37B|nr:uncharacterized protein LOC129317495 [Prosopis cineraria]